MTEAAIGPIRLRKRVVRFGRSRPNGRGRRCANTGSGSQNELLRLLRHLSSSRKILITSSAYFFSSPVISAGGSSEFTFFFNSHQLRRVSAKPCFKSHSLRASSRRFEMGCTFTTVSVARLAPTSRIVASIAVALAGSRLHIRGGLCGRRWNE